MENIQFFNNLKDKKRFKLKCTPEKSKSKWTTVRNVWRLARPFCSRTRGEGGREKVGAV